MYSWNVFQERNPKVTIVSFRLVIVSFCSCKWASELIAYTPFAFYKIPKIIHFCCTRVIAFNCFYTFSYFITISFIWKNARFVSRGPSISEAFVFFWKKIVSFKSRQSIIEFHNLFTFLYLMHCSLFHLTHLHSQFCHHTSE